jgi:hypothetical protein
MNLKRGIIETVCIVILLIPMGVVGVKDYNSTGTELKHDDGTVDWGWGVLYRGCAVKFSVEKRLWVVDKVSFRALWEGKNKTFEIEVWDENLNEIARSKKYNFSKYFTRHTGEYIKKEDYEWVTVDIPDVEVTGDFYIAIFENADDDGIIWFAFNDSGEGKESSFFVFRDPNMMTERSSWINYNGPLTWLLRVTGYEGTVILANSIDEAYSPVIENEIKREYRNTHAKRTGANEFDAYKENSVVIFLGGPDAYGGVGEIVSGILTQSEKAYLRTEGNYALYVKRDLWRENQVVIILAGSDREGTLKAVGEYRERVLAEIDELIFNTKE